MGPALFAAFSAFSACDLSLGVTGSLNTFGRQVIMAMMFWGRLGALTIAVAILQRRSAEQLPRYPEETILMG